MSDEVRVRLRLRNSPAQPYIKISASSWTACGPAEATIFRSVGAAHYWIERHKDAKAIIEPLEGGCGICKKKV